MRRHDTRVAREVLLERGVWAEKLTMSLVVACPLRIISSRYTLAVMTRIQL